MLIGSQPIPLLQVYFFFSIEGTELQGSGIPFLHLTITSISFNASSCNFRITLGSPNRFDRLLQYQAFWTFLYLQVSRTNNWDRRWGSMYRAFWYTEKFPPSSDWLINRNDRLVTETIFLEGIETKLPLPKQILTKSRTIWKIFRILYDSTLENGGLFPSW